MAYDLTDLVTVEQAKSLATRSHSEVVALESRMTDTIAGVYKVKGTLAPEGILAALLVAANEGNVYNISGAFTTTADFVEGAGKTHTAGTNIVVVNTGTSEAPAYKFDVFSGDLSGLQVLVSSATSGNLAGLDATGQSTDSGVAAADVVVKVSGGTENNIVALDANGKIKDSGVAIATNAEFGEMLTEIYGLQN